MKAPIPYYTVVNEEGEALLEFYAQPEFAEQDYYESNAGPGGRIVRYIPEPEDGVLARNVLLEEVAAAANAIRVGWAFGQMPDSRRWPEEARLYRALEAAGIKEKS